MTLNRQERLVGIADLYCKGWKQYDIAHHYKISTAQVSHDLKEIRQKWLDSRIKDYDTLKAEELERIDRLEKRCWQQFEASIGKKIVHKNEVTSKDGENFVKQSQTIRESDGDIRWLEQIFHLIELRCKITGLIGKDASGPIIARDEQPFMPTEDEKQRIRAAAYAQLGRVLSISRSNGPVEPNGYVVGGPQPGDDSGGHDA